MDAEFKNKKEVVFDGKDLIFNVDGIEIKTGNCLIPSVYKSAMR